VVAARRQGDFHAQIRHFYPQSGHFVMVWNALVDVVDKKDIWLARFDAAG
jgi:hypothetical protein